jgi:fructokinase
VQNRTGTEGPIGRKDGPAGGRRFVVAGVGELLWDIFPEGARLGGAPANFAFHAGALGAEAYVVSRVGADDLGERALSDLRASGLDGGYIQVDGRYPTGTVSVTIEKDGIPSYIIHEDAAWDHIEAGPEALDLAGRADAVCYGSLAQRSPGSGAAIMSILGGTREGCFRVLDINLRQSYYGRESLLALINRSTMLKLNMEELAVLARMFDFPGGEDEALDRLLDRFSLEIIALTKGGQGSRLHSRSADSSHPGIKVRVVDTVGAGDAFTAALVMGVLQGKDFGTINEEANRLAAAVCTRSGAMSKLSPPDIQYK